MEDNGLYRISIEMQKGYFFERGFDTSGYSDTIHVIVHNEGDSAVGLKNIYFMLDETPRELTRIDNEPVPDAVNTADLINNLINRVTVIESNSSITRNYSLKDVPNGELRIVAVLRDGIEIIGRDSLIISK